MECDFVCRIDLDMKQVHIRLWLPVLRVTAHYEMTGRILILPIAGSGYSEGNYSKCVCAPPPPPPRSAEYS
jgi:hypothetical protein